MSARKMKFTVLFGLFFAFSAAQASAAAVLETTISRAPSVLEAGKDANYVVDVANVGDEPTTGAVSVEVTLPEGVETRMREASGFPMGTVTSGSGSFASEWSCPTSTTPGESSITCTRSNPISNGRIQPRISVYVSVAADAAGELSVSARAFGGDAGESSDVDVATVGSGEPPFGIVPGTFLADVFDREGSAERRAGAHPFRAKAAFDLNLRATGDSNSNPFNLLDPVTQGVESLRRVEVELPRGFVGNPLAMPRCPQKLVPAQATDPATGCPANTQVGVIDLELQPTLETARVGRLPIYNVKPPQGALADLAFAIGGRPVHILAKLDPSDYSVVTVVPNINETIPLRRQVLTLWGVPADPGHDADRMEPNGIGGQEAGVPEKPFLSLPTQCGVSDNSRLRTQSWLGSEDPQPSEPPFGSEPAEVNGCSQLEFEPAIVARPTTNLADAPSGLEFEMTIPQNEDPDGLATAHLRDAVVKLPEGMTVNASSADGLGACSLSEIGLGTNDPVRCPDASKIGSAEVESPAVDHPLKGALYLAEQNANPFGSLLAAYLVIDDTQTGMLVKLPGKVEADPSTGQLTTTFRDNPQLPVEVIRLALKEGPRAPLKTPATCGTHETKGALTPWSAPEAASKSVDSSFELTQGPSGGACLNGGGSAPHGPAFNAGTLDPTAKAFSPFVLRLARADGTQQMKAIDTLLPQGLTAKLAGVPYCSDAALSAAASKSGKVEQASSSCPLASRVGSVDVGAGAGSTPLHVGGQAYLAGPYKGAPLSLAIVTPAVAGPFDLGTVVVRTALQVNPETAQVRAVSDEIPRILQGIPLNIRSIALKMDRPEFMLNPTSCDPMSVDGSALSVFGQSAPLSTRFQVGECNRLGFKPKLAVRFSGAKPRRGGYPKLTATLTMPPGGANIARGQVTMPKTQFLENAHIRTICTRVQYAAKACPPGSVYGYAKAWSPLLDQPLEGPVYLRSSSNKLPDLAVSLDGQIHVDLIGRITSSKGRIRNTFDLVPDAPVSKFVLTMEGGRKGLLVNNTNLCRAKPRASVEFDGQNGKVSDSTPLVKVSGCGKKKRK